MSKKIFLILASLIFSLSTLVYANDSSSLNKDLQTIIHNYLTGVGKKEGISGVAVAVYLPGKNKGDLRQYFAGNIGFPPYNTPITENNLFEIGSITKSFASAIILQLEGEGKLSINDKIGRWLPQYPQWKNVTIRQLLEMRSGIPNYTKNKKFIEKLFKNIQADFTNKELLELAYPNQRVTPDVKFDYSNTNYILAGMIIETITGDTFAHQLKKRILQPLNLQDTYYVAGSNWKEIRKEIMPRMIHGYYYDPTSKKMVDITNSNLSWAGPAGAIVSDTDDVIRWIRGLFSGEIFAPSYRQKALQELKTVIRINKSSLPISTPHDAKDVSFGLGVGGMRLPHQGHFWVYEGSGLGFRATYVLNPCNNVIVFSALNNKGDEANPSVGDHILQLNLDLYKKIIASSPQYLCNN